MHFVVGNLLESLGVSGVGGWGGQVPVRMQALVGDMASLLTGARADSTNRKYMYGFSEWRQWAESNGVAHNSSIWPLYCALYLTAAAQQSNCFK